VALAIWDMSNGEIDLRQLLPIHMRPALKRPRDAGGIARKPLGRKVSKLPVTA
jgi:hypothetical protein